MKSYFFLIGVFYLINCTGQDKIDDYLGAWTGQLEEKDAFNFDVELSKEISEKAFIIFRGKSSNTKIDLKKEDEVFVGSFKDQLLIKLRYIDNVPQVFVKVGHHLCFLNFKKSDSGKWKTSWKLLLNNDFVPTMYMSLDKGQDGTYFASTFWKEPSLHYTFANDFRFSEDRFEFRDIRSMINFNGLFVDNHIQMELCFLNEKTTIIFSSDNYDNWRQGAFDKLDTHPPIVDDISNLFQSLTNDILADTLERTHNIVIQQNNAIIYEAYFDGFHKDIPHDTRSGAKSFASSVIGIAIDEKLISSELKLIKPYFDKDYPNMYWSNDKDKVNIHHLLTMSTGMDMIDFGLNRMSFANEGTYQNQEDWTGYILKAPMVLPIGKEGNYGSGSPHLLGPILEKVIDYPLEFYIHSKLFAPLQITNYRIQSDNQGSPYFGGGWYFTPRDLVKFGQLYLNGGNWNGKQLISQSWVQKSMLRHVNLENTNNKNPYGYLFWHEDYELNGQMISSIECRGSGGQYVFMIPKLNLVVAISSGNYQNGKFMQPETILKDYILPKLLK